MVVRLAKAWSNFKTSHATPDRSQAAFPLGAYAVDCSGDLTSQRQVSYDEPATESRSGDNDADVIIT
jgi:hypothetical protein